MCLVYLLQQLDKSAVRRYWSITFKYIINTLCKVSYSAVFGIVSEAHLVGTQYRYAFSRAITFPNQN